MDTALYVMYRHFDSSRNLLYIGISDDIYRRTREHVHDSAWYRECVHVTVEHVGSRQEARAAEREAIQRESPRENKQWNTGRVSPVRAARKVYAKRAVCAEPSPHAPTAKVVLAPLAAWPFPTTTARWPDELPKPVRQSPAARTVRAPLAAWPFPTTSTRPDGTLPNPAPNIGVVTKRKTH